MNIGIVGLGLIGGSLAKAVKEYTNASVFGYDIDSITSQYAILSGSVDEILGKENIAKCDYIFICLYPQASIDYMERMGVDIAPDTVIVDCCGIKRSLNEAGFMLADKYGFTFVGGHPMAGRQYAGYKYSMPDLYQGATMILTPKDTNDLEMLNALAHLLRSLGFAHINITSANKHDAVIAYTSQLAHIVANAYIKSPRAEDTVGFTGGSYEDMTRVARLNAEMWTELFMANKDNLESEIELLINNLEEYRRALQNNDAMKLNMLLEQGNTCKERIDKSHV